MTTTTTARSTVRGSWSGVIENGDVESRRHLVEQLRITFGRARILRLAIMLSSMSILCDRHGAAFGLGLLALLGSLYYFIADMTISLSALELEISPYTVERI